MRSRVAHLLSEGLLKGHATGPTRGPRRERSHFLRSAPAGVAASRACLQADRRGGGLGAARPARTSGH
eukprot:13782514-Alexandrium_andersonii.AAC.1